MDAISYIKSWFSPQEAAAPTILPGENVLDRLLKETKELAAEVEPLIDQGIPPAAMSAIEARAHSIQAQLNELVKEKTAHFEALSFKELRAVENKSEFIKNANKILEVVNACSDKDQNVDLNKAPGIDTLLQKLKDEGFVIDIKKKNYTRNEKQDLVTSVEYRIKSAQNDIALHTQKCHQHSQMKSAVYEAAISIAKTLKDLTSKIYSR